MAAFAVNVDETIIERNLLKLVDFLHRFYDLLQVCKRYV